MPTNGKQNKGKRFLSPPNELLRHLQVQGTPQRQSSEEQTTDRTKSNVNTIFLV